MTLQIFKSNFLAKSEASRESMRRATFTPPYHHISGRPFETYNPATPNSPTQQVQMAKAAVLRCRVVAQLCLVPFLLEYFEIIDGQPPLQPLQTLFFFSALLFGHTFLISTIPGLSKPKTENLSLAGPCICSHLGSSLGFSFLLFVFLSISTSDAGALLLLSTTTNPCGRANSRSRQLPRPRPRRRRHSRRRCPRDPCCRRLPWPLLGGRS